MSIEELKAIRIKAVFELRSAPEGKLERSKSHGVVQFYHCLPDKPREYISKYNTTLLKVLAQKKYNLEIIKAVDKQIKCCEMIMETYNSHCLEDIYERFPDELKDYIKPYTLPVNEIVARWRKETYFTKSDSTKDITYKTDKGELVRSKSELIIANKLFANNIPYRYECRLELNNGVFVFPDFTIMNPKTGKVIIWEHFGLMDKAEYANSFVRKINTLINEGYVLGKNLVCTFETSSQQLDLSVLKKTIQLISDVDGEELPL